jgi:hypothetical protein
MSKQISKYYTDIRKKINLDYDPLGTIDDYLSEDTEINSAAVIYDLSTFIKICIEKKSREWFQDTNYNHLLDEYGVLLFDIYGNFNLFKKLPLSVKFKNFMNVTMPVEIPEELYNIIGDRQPYIYECFFWSDSILKKVFLGKIKKLHVDKLKEIFLLIKPDDSLVIKRILGELQKMIPEKNVTFIDYISSNEPIQIQGAISVICTQDDAEDGSHETMNNHTRKLLPVTSSPTTV